MKLILVRHGEADSKTEGTPLTEKGISQAKILSKELKKYDFDKIYSSPLLRAKQTCEEFTKNYIEDERLKEIYCVLIGGPIKEGTSLNRKLQDKENVESIFTELIDFNEKNILIFTHANLIRYFIKKILNINNKNLWKEMIIDNCSMIIIEKNENKIFIKVVNKNDYLPSEDLVKYIEN
jgi:broad specificity phosphatase PhoE